MLKAEDRGVILHIAPPNSLGLCNFYHVRRVPKEILEIRVDRLRLSISL